MGADCVMHSTTKYLAGHSDALGGALAVKDPAAALALRSERALLGSVPSCPLISTHFAYICAKY
jgi:cystathionine beta-lyase/cystathionine gamma-synthase